MPHTVTCTTCFRVETWHPSTEGWQVEVSSPGAGRRPAQHPQHARGLAALRALAGPDRVVGVCSACGQLQLCGDPELPEMQVRIDLPEGPLLFGAGVVEGPEGPLDAETVQARLERAFGRPRFEGWWADLAKVPLFFVFVPLFLGWVAAGVFVLAFLSAVWQGAPRAVSDAPVAPVSQTP